MTTEDGKESGADQKAGGAYFKDNVSVGGDSVGRDKLVHGDEVRGDKIVINFPGLLDSVKIGLKQLTDRISNDPTACNGVTLSQEMRDTAQRISEMQLLKTIHDSLHTIEFEILRQMQALRRTRIWLDPLQFQFDQQSHQIKEAIRGRETDPFPDLGKRLDLIEADFQEAVNAPENTAILDKVKTGLEQLRSRIPPRLDSMISNAAKELKLNRLVELLESVKETLSVEHPENDVLLVQFVQSINALNGLRADLERRVREHGQLQRLDDGLRALLANKLSPGGLDCEWELTKTAASELIPPFIDKDMDNLKEKLSQMEIVIDEALDHNDKKQARILLMNYSQFVGTAFREADRRLKDFCNRLSELNQPLQTLLRVC